MGSQEKDAHEANGRNAEPPILIRGLRKSFGEQKVLDGIDLQVAEGESLAVLGLSGTGKSVLLKLIVGLQEADSGSIHIRGQEIRKLPLEKLNEIRKKIGFLFQSAALYDSLTVEENVAFPLERHTRMSRAERREKARELLSSVGMDKDLGKLPSELSGGMQKRVGLARALALQPDILLFDEPTAGLDPITSEEINSLILHLRKQRAMATVVVTHDVHSAHIVATRLALMRDGNIMIEGTFEDLQKSQDQFVSQFLRHGS